VSHPAPRVPGKYGRLSPDPGRPRLTLEKYLDPRTPLSAAGLPPVSWTADVDRSSQVQQIPMYLNNELGDCTIAGLAHLFGAVSVYGGRAEALFADAEIERTYSRVGGYVPGNPATDQGCACADVLEDARVNGMTDVNGNVHKVAGHAQLGNPADEELVAQCLDVFGSLYVGFNVQQSIEAEFSAGQVWTYTPGEPYVGGHCVVLQRRYPCGSMHGVLEYWTWGARQRADFGWQANTVEEAHVAITDDWIRANGTTVEGLDLVQLLADMAYVTLYAHAVLQAAEAGRAPRRLPCPGRGY